MVSQKLLAIAFSLLILVQAWAVKRYVGTWLFPGCILGLFWFAYTFVPLVLVFHAPVEPMSVAFILLGCAAFSLSGLFFDWKRAYQAGRETRSHARYDGVFLKLAFYALSIIVVVCLMVNWRLQGFTFVQIVFDFYETSLQYVTLRNRGEVQKNIFSQVGVFLTYAATAIGGFVYGAERRRWVRLLVIGVAMLPSVLAMLVEGNKGAIFLAIALFWGAGLAFKVSVNDRNIFGGISWGQMIFFLLAILVLVTFAFVVRIDGIHAEDMGDAARKMKWYFLSYVCGHLYAFSDWFSWLIGKGSSVSYQEVLNGGGFYTFIGLFKLFGDERFVPPGIYGEYFIYGDLIQSNIYTIFRGLVIDFGVIGALIFWVVLGLVAHLFFRWLVVGAWVSLSATFFVFLIGFFYTSFIISLWIWNSVFASFLVVVVVLYANEKVSRSRAETGGAI